MENITIRYDGSQDELIIRQGDAPPIPERKAIRIDGLLEAPGEYVSKRKSMINPFLTHVTVERLKGKITLVTGDDDEFANTITGQLKANPALRDFRINGEAWASPADLGDFLRRGRRFFANKEQGGKLVESLATFKAKVSREIEKSNDKRGNYTDAVSQQVATEIPSTFDLEIPIFQGHDSVVFQVEIFFEIRDAGCRIYLQSIELDEIIESTTNSLIDEQLPIFQDYAILEI